MPVLHIKPLHAAGVFSGLCAGALAVFLWAGNGTAAAAGAPPVFAPHKAMYDFGMIAVTSGAAISDIRGKMFYEQDDVCDAWTTDHRYTMSYYYPERQPVVNTSHYVAWESKDQNQFQFNSERQENGVVTELLRGSVLREEAGSTKAEYVRPAALSFDLPKGYFLPTAHLKEVVRRAQAGEKFFYASMFDGTDADGPIDVNVFIGDKVTPDEMKKLLTGPAGKKLDAKLLPAEAWHVRMAIFPLKDGSAMVPVYEMALVLHANSVVSHVVVDYKSFKVEQRLTALESLPPHDCP
jgi:hypothetical protein